MRIEVSETYVLLTESACSIVNQGTAIVANYPTAVTVDGIDPDAPDPVINLVQDLDASLTTLTQSLAKGLYRSNCGSIITDDVEDVYNILRSIQSGISEYEVKSWYSKHLVNLVCSVGAYQPILAKAVKERECMS